MVGSPNYWVLEDNGRIIAALACPEDPQHAAWIRLFLITRIFRIEAWSALGSGAKRHIQPAG